MLPCSGSQVIARAALTSLFWAALRNLPTTAAGRFEPLPPPSASTRMTAATATTATAAPPRIHGVLLRPTVRGLSGRRTVRRLTAAVGWLLAGVRLLWVARSGVVSHASLA